MTYVAPWALSEAHRITDYTEYLTDTAAIKLVQEIASAFNTKVVPILHKLIAGNGTVKYVLKRILPYSLLYYRYGQKSYSITSSRHKWSGHVWRC